MSLAAEESLRLRRRRCITALSAAAAALFLFGLIILGFQFRYSGWNNSVDHSRTGSVFVLVKNAEIQTSVMPFLISHRKILQAPEGNKVETERIWKDKCATSDILITQGPTEPMHGIPTYTVEISNVSPTGSDISGIHLTCGWFTSARLINPKIFKRLDYDDCLVNDGQPLVNGRTLSFQYASTFTYRLSVNSVNC